jgi:hypothetical protein
VAVSTDPQFGTCTEAKKHGYGPYYQGKDPEYDCYQDRDHDGIVCEYALASFAREQRRGSTPRAAY